jgi:hypothetical protein
MELLDKVKDIPFALAFLLPAKCDHVSALASTVFVTSPHRTSHDDPPHTRSPRPRPARTPHTHNVMPRPAHRLTEHTSRPEDRTQARPLTPVASGAVARTTLARAPTSPSTHVKFAAPRVGPTRAPSCICGHGGTAGSGGRGAGQGVPAPPSGSRRQAVLWKPSRRPQL